jgi:FtsH-binding integral membrane protein
MTDTVRTIDQRLPGSPPHDQGVQDYLSSVYLRMAGGVAISAGMAWVTANSVPLSSALFTSDGLTVLGWIITIAPLGLVMILSAGIDRLSMRAARLVFTGYAALVGMSLGGLALAYTGTSLATTFAAAAVGFGVLAMVGRSSRLNFSRLGGFLTVAVVGLLIATSANLFFKSGPTDVLLSGAGIMTFAALTVFDAQRLKTLYHDGSDQTGGRAAILGALTLYLDYLNLFLFMVRFTGRSRR